MTWELVPKRWVSANGVPKQRTLGDRKQCPKCDRLIFTTVNGAFIWHKCERHD